MKFQVIYFSRKGNTKKVAEAIASEFDVEVEDVKDAKLDKNAFIFLGSGCYGGKPAKLMTNFIQNNDFRSRNVALFGTSASGGGKEVAEMERILGAAEAAIKGTFFCKGKFIFFNRDRPSEEDLKGAQNFAKRMMQ